MLVLATITAAFLAGTFCGVLAMVIIGIHAEEHRADHSKHTRAGAASIRLLRTHTSDIRPSCLEDDVSR